MITFECEQWVYYCRAVIIFHARENDEQWNGKKNNNEILSWARNKTDEHYPLCCALCDCHNSILSWVMQLFSFLFSLTRSYTRWRGCICVCVEHALHSLLFPSILTFAGENERSCTTERMCVFAFVCFLLPFMLFETQQIHCQFSFSLFLLVFFCLFFIAWWQLFKLTFEMWQIILKV